MSQVKLNKTKVTRCNKTNILQSISLPFYTEKLNNISDISYIYRKSIQKKFCVNPEGIGIDTIKERLVSLYTDQNMKYVPINNILFWETDRKIAETLKNIQDNLDFIPHRTKNFVMIPTLATKVPKSELKKSKSKQLYYSHWIVLLISKNKLQIFDPTLQTSKQIIEETDKDATPYLAGNLKLPYNNTCYVNNKRTQAFTEESKICGFQVADFMACVNSMNSIQDIEQVIEHIEDIRNYIKEKTLTLEPEKGKDIRNQLPTEWDEIILKQTEPRQKQIPEQNKQTSENQQKELAYGKKIITLNNTKQTPIYTLRQVFIENQPKIQTPKALRGYQEKQRKMSHNKYKNGR